MTQVLLSGEPLRSAGDKSDKLLPDSKDRLLAPNHHQKADKVQCGGHRFRRHHNHCFGIYNDPASVRLCVVYANSFLDNTPSVPQTSSRFYHLFCIYLYMDEYNISLLLSSPPMILRFSQTDCRTQYICIQYFSYLVWHVWRHIDKQENSVYHVHV